MIIFYPSIGYPDGISKVPKIPNNQELTEKFGSTLNGDTCTFVKSELLLCV